VKACKAIAEEAKGDPSLLFEAPTKPKARRMNETEAARRPCLAG